MGLVIKKSHFKIRIGMVESQTHIMVIFPDLKFQVVT